jgi:hypothetical protein
VPLIRLRWRSEMRLRRSWVVLIFIASPLISLGDRRYFAPVFPAFFFSTSPV